VYSGNRNDLFKIIAQFQRLVAWCAATGISLKALRLDMGKSFDFKELRHFYFQYSTIPDVKENERTRKKPKPGPSKNLMKRPI